MIDRILEYKKKILIAENNKSDRMHISTDINYLKR